ncbi:PKD domain-containing protein [Kitasatospora camelliae]|uniref:PKD domain-containing protein n=1 Tax=Kitasatospora camelliae TaxID=3156397 RepID=A0AAU8JWD7_9ACTN
MAAATVVLGLPTPATAAGSTMLIVNNATGSNCSDTGPGTLAQPYCTISAAAKVVQPGQTVKVLPSSRLYTGDTVRLTRSGTPEQPITFLGGQTSSDAMSMPLLTGGTSSFVLNNVHDVVIKGFRYDRVKDPIVITDSSRITVDQNWFSTTSGTADIRVSGTSDHVTVSRGLFPDTLGVAVDSGARSTLITGNDFSRTTTSAVTVKDAPQTAVTNNTIAFSCQESVLVDGASPGAVIENNVITADHPATTKDYPAECDAAHRGEAEISLSAGSVTDSKVDYNTVHPWPDAAAYRWNGTAYPTPAAFTTATGQGAHDTDLDVAFVEDFPAWPFHRLPAGAGAAVDSADPTAPGTGTDIFGSKPVDDPRTANTAPAGGVRDRGAYENVGLQGTLTVRGTQIPNPRGPVPLTVKATATATESFGTSAVTYTFDFGDGTAPAVSTTPEATHTYTVPGSYVVTATLTTANGARTTTDGSTVTVTPAGDLAPDFTAEKKDDAGTFVLTPAVTSPWPLTKAVLTIPYGGDFDVTDGRAVWFRFDKPGTYNVTLTATDAVGHQATTTKAVTVQFSAEQLAMLPGERVQLVARTADSLLGIGANYTSGIWGTPSNLPPNSSGVQASSVGSMASTVSGDGYLRAFYVAGTEIYGVDRNLAGARQEAMGTSDRGTWFGSSALSLHGAGYLSGVTQVSAASIGRYTHVVALAAYGRVYETTGDHASGTWTPWGDVTAAAHLPAGATQIAAGTTGNSLHIAALGADGHIRVADGDYTRGTWGSGDLTAYIGGPSQITQLTAATLGSKFHVLALSGGNVHQTSGDYAAGNWSSWANVSSVIGLPGAVTQVSAAATGNSLRLFGVSGGHVYNANGDYTQGRWWPWADVTAPGAAGTTAPVTAVTAAGTN